jgi:hypothetical protein
MRLVRWCYVAFAAQTVERQRPHRDRRRRIHNPTACPAPMLGEPATDLNLDAIQSRTIGLQRPLLVRRGGCSFDA